MHELNHSHWAGIHEDKYPIAMPSDGVPSWKDAPPVKLAEKSIPDRTSFRWPLSTANSRTCPSGACPYLSFKRAWHEPSW